MIKPPFIAVIFGFLGMLYSCHFFYEIWRKPKKALNRSRKAAYNLPKWYPLRGLAIDLANDEKFYITYNRIMSIFAGIVIIGAEILLVIAWFIGK